MSPNRHSDLRLKAICHEDKGILKGNATLLGPQTQYIIWRLGYRYKLNSSRKKKHLFNFYEIVISTSLFDIFASPSLSWARDLFTILILWNYRKACENNNFIIFFIKHLMVLETYFVHYLVGLSSFTVKIYMAFSSKL